jgi:hypothetical protein
MHAVVEYVTLASQLGTDDVGKGVYFEAFLFYDPDALFRGMARVEFGWLGGTDNKHLEQKFEFVVREKFSWLSRNAPRIIARLGRHTASSAEDRRRNKAERVPPGAIVFPCQIPGFMGRKTVWMGLGVSGLYGWRDHAAVTLAANAMRAHPNPDVRWHIQGMDVREVACVRGNPYWEFLERELLESHLAYLAG